MNLTDKKGYHIYVCIDIIKAFKKLCVDESVPFSQALETLMLRELDRRGRLEGLTLADLTYAAKHFSKESSPKVDVEPCSVQ